MENFAVNTYDLYSDIKHRTGGEIYIGVVGPVRTGKSTFIKRFMEQLVLPEMEDEHRKNQTRDELPQSAAGRQDDNDDGAEVYTQGGGKGAAWRGRGSKGTADRLCGLYGGRSCRTHGRGCGAHGKNAVVGA